MSLIEYVMLNPQAQTVDQLQSTAVKAAGHRPMAVVEQLGDESGIGVVDETGFRMTSDSTMGALAMAVHQRQVGPGLIHPSDQGSQYTDGEYRQMLRDRGIQVSMNGVGTWYDNAPMESFFGTLKSEWVHRRTYGTRDEATVDLFYYIEAFYNRHRLHSISQDAPQLAEGMNGRGR